jgi:hypothetical protein
MSIVKLKDKRLFFPALFEAKAFKDSSTFSATLGIEPGSADDKAIEAAISEVAVGKFGEKKAAARIAAFRPVPQQFPYRDGNTVNWEGAEGLMIIKGSKQEKTGMPLVLSNVRYSGDDLPSFKGKFIELHDEKGTPYGRDADGKLVKLSDVDDEITVPYSGCYVNASIEFWAQDGDNAGIRCSLRGVQFSRDGDSFAGGSKAKADEFDELNEGADADNEV